jgi:DNA-binding response OmpR family regulator
VGFALGAASYFVKPVKKDALLAAIRQHVRAKSPGDAEILIIATALGRQSRICLSCSARLRASQ